MIYVVEVNGAPLVKHPNVYAYTSLRAAEASARSLGGSVVAYSVNRSDEGAEKLARTVQSLALELEEAHRIGSGIEDLVRRVIRDDESVAAGLSRLASDSARLRRLAKLVRAELGEDPPT